MKSLKINNYCFYKNDGGHQKSITAGQRKWIIHNGCIKYKLLVPKIFIIFNVL